MSRLLNAEKPSSNSLKKSLLFFEFPIFHNQVQKNSCNSCCSDTAEAESADFQREVAGTDDQRNSRHNQILAGSQIDLVFNHDPHTGGGNETENNHGNGTEQRSGNRLYQGTELR